MAKEQREISTIMHVNALKYPEVTSEEVNKTVYGISTGVTLVNINLNHHVSPTARCGGTRRY